jgi:predicted transcriptional regulator
MSKRPDYKNRILECISENLHGITITDISKKLEITRNTVYKYLEELEKLGLIHDKKFKSYTLYFLTEKNILYKEATISFFKGLLANLKKIHPNEEKLYKLIGRNIADSMEVPFVYEGREYLKKLKNFSDLEILESFGDYFPYFNILDDSINISEIEIIDKKAILTFVNSDMLEHSDDYIYYFYLIVGIIEKKLSEYTGKEIRFEVLNYETFDKKEKSYVKLSFDFQVLLPEIEIEGIEEADVPNSDVIDVELIKMDVKPSTLALILRSCFFKKKVLYLNDNELLHSHLNEFFRFIYEDSFEIDVKIGKSEIYERNKKKFDSFVVLDDRGVIKDKTKILKLKDVKVEPKIVQKFISETNPKSSLMKLRNEIQKAFKVAKEASEEVVLEDLETMYETKISISYIKFLVDIVENYFQVKVPEHWKFLLALR